MNGENAQISETVLDPSVHPPVDPAPVPQPRASRPPTGPGTREMVLGWCLWLIGSWGIVLALARSGPVLGPIHRWMSLMALIGFCAVWPAVRLSQEARTAWGQPAETGLPRREILIDWVALNAVFQAVLWPMAFVARWSLPQVLLLGSAIATWSLLAGLITAWGRATASGTTRAAAMGGCLAVLLLEPLALFAAAVLRGTGWGGLPDLRLSPLQVVWAYSGPSARFAFIDPAFAYRVAGVGLAALVGWVIFLVVGPRRGRRG